MRREDDPVLRRSRRYGEGLAVVALGVGVAFAYLAVRGFGDRDAGLSRPIAAAVVAVLGLGCGGFLVFVLYRAYVSGMPKRQVGGADAADDATGNDAGGGDEPRGTAEGGPSWWRRRPDGHDLTGLVPPGMLATVSAAVCLWAIAFIVVGAIEHRTRTIIYYIIVVVISVVYIYRMYRLRGK